MVISEDVQVLVEAVHEGQKFSILLQNAETVRLVGSRSESAGDITWHSTSVTDLSPGDSVLIYRTEAARHTGVAIEEHVIER